MSDEYCEAMMELCMSLGSSTYHGHTHSEEEALLYQQLCRTISIKAKLDEMSCKEIEDMHAKDKDKPDDETGVPV